MSVVGKKGEKGPHKLGFLCVSPVIPDDADAHGSEAIEDVTKVCGVEHVVLEGLGREVTANMVFLSGKGRVYRQPRSFLVTVTECLAHPVHAPRPEHVVGLR